MIERAIEAAWPGAHAVTAPASPPLPPGALATGGTLRLARPEILPLQHRSRPRSPLRALAGAGRGLADGEHAIVQVLARPVTGARLRRARRAARQLRAGRPARPQPPGCWTSLTPGGHSGSRAPGRGPLRPRAGRRGAGQRHQVGGPAVGNPDPLRHRHHRRPGPRGAGRGTRRPQAQARARLRGLAHGLASATALYAGRNWLARRRLRHPAAADRRPPVPPRRPAVGARAGRDRPPARRPVAARPGPRRGPRRRPAARHPRARPATSGRWGSPTPGCPARSASPSPTPATTCGSCGPTGTGKTTLIAGQILADADAGRGVVFIDPKGDAVTDLLARLPEDAAGKVVLFDPGDRARAAVPERAARRRQSGTDPT